MAKLKKPKASTEPSTSTDEFAKLEEAIRNLPARYIQDHFTRNITVQGSDVSLEIVYSPSCPHCQQFWPQLVRLFELLSEHEGMQHQMVVTGLNQSNRELMDTLQRDQVQGTPEILAHLYGKMKRYSGELDAQAILDWYLGLTKVQLTEIATQKEMNTELKNFLGDDSNDALIFAVGDLQRDFTGTDHNLIELWHNQFKRKHFKILQSSSDKLREKHGVSAPGQFKYYIYGKFEDTLVTLATANNWEELKGLKNKLQSFEFRLFGKFSIENNWQLTHSQRPTLILFIDTIKNPLMKFYKKIAEFLIKDGYSCSYSTYADRHVPEHSSLRNFIGVVGDTPQLYVMHHSDKEADGHKDGMFKQMIRSKFHKDLPNEEQATEDNDWEDDLKEDLNDWVHEHSRGLLRPHQKFDGGDSLSETVTTQVPYWTGSSY